MRWLRWWRLRGTETWLFDQVLPPLDGQFFYGWRRIR
jgi:hypothetical protein